ncbi:ATP-grasp domain-containing protein [Salegentibacter sp. JZCK2]|uniref:ATP-grasp domain-containing protein n=1 Tax=Salegentibacter tibetensis TaxID=2873600 RepID=UPI001CCD957C|nr:ATP-grasp domain-containing protein [Salegentibacter tibetensis]MBZ9731096.1 ATP-grasp domain-containing protein [Salegentibacter tibetensis]
MSTNKRNNAIAIYHEHQDWFRPLFTELEKKEIHYQKFNAAEHHFKIAEKDFSYDVFFNRMSPSAYLRNNTQAIFYTTGLLASLESKGIKVINGSKAWRYEISKALQLSLLESLGLPYPKSVVINHASQAVAASEDLRFPIVVKANIGGSGAGITLFNSKEELKQAVADDKIELGLDFTALVQEFIPARGGHINRVETLNGKFLYAIKVYTSGESFNLCPADICQTTGGQELARNACAVDAPKNGLRVEGFTPEQEIINSIEKIIQAAGIDVGGIEYIIDDRDGQLYYYDINALSNFVADAVNVIGFNPHEKLVDYIEKVANLKLEVK